MYEDQMLDPAELVYSSDRVLEDNVLVALSISVETA